MTTRVLETRLIRHFSLSRADARRVIRTLIADGRLAYIYLYGQSYIDLGLRCPTPISRRVILYPQGCKEQPALGEPVIVIESGAAFGDGRHPTTRLAVEGLEEVQMSAAREGARAAIRRGLDIGTGSGILAIAAARLGVAQVDALDIDPCALNEARRNIVHNQLSHRVKLGRQAIEDLEVHYDLVMANLRLPTLCDLAARVRRRIHPSSYLVFSGFRDQEQGALQRAYPESAFRLIWSRTLAGWRGVVLRAV
jgi:ribosomal protein L11 methyltransferase